MHSLFCPHCWLAAIAAILMAIPYAKSYWPIIKAKLVGNSDHANCEDCREESDEHNCEHGH